MTKQHTDAQGEDTLPTSLEEAIEKYKTAGGTLPFYVVSQDWLDASLSKQREQAQQESQNELYKTRADLAWCLGKLRGLGYPAELLEEQYDMRSEPKEENKNE